MNSVWQPWLKLAGAWVTAVVLFLATLAYLIWQTSGPIGRRGQITKQVEEFETEIESLEKTVNLAFEERVMVAETSAEIDRIAGEIFGQIDQRLTSVLREIGVISRNSGLIPEGFGYVIQKQEKSGGIRFGTSFSVEGTYDQVRRLLSGLQASPQFLIIDKISFKGEEDPRSQTVGIGLQISTYLADTEPEALRALINMLEIDDVDLVGPVEEAGPESAPVEEISSEDGVELSEDSDEAVTGDEPPDVDQPAGTDLEEGP